MAKHGELLAGLLRWTLGSSGALAVVVGVAPWSYDKLAGQSAPARQATDMLAELNPAIDVHRREADLLRSRTRRVGGLMLRSGDFETVSDRVDELSLVVSDFQTTSVDLEKLTFEILTPQTCHEPIASEERKTDEQKRKDAEDKTPAAAEAREKLALCDAAVSTSNSKVLPQALRDVVNAAEAINDCVQRIEGDYDQNAKDYMQSMAERRGPEETSRTKASMESLRCRNALGRNSLKVRLDGLDACSTAIRHSLIQVRDDIEDVRRENAWSRTWHDFRSWMGGLGRKRETQNVGVALAALDDTSLKRVGADCSDKMLRGEDERLTGADMTPWAGRTAPPPEGEIDMAAAGGGEAAALPAVEPAPPVPRLSPS